MGLTPTPVAERPSLTRDDIEVLTLLAEGLPLSTIGRRLHLSERSIRRRLRMICDRLGCRSSIQAVVWAARRGLV
ncbi:MAG TPA: LuxR C-terminal-related transcriptional regulator [Jiangellaceae bacterium]